MNFCIRAMTENMVVGGYKVPQFERDQLRPIAVACCSLISQFRYGRIDLWWFFRHPCFERQLIYGGGREQPDRVLVQFVCLLTQDCRCTPNESFLLFQWCTFLRRKTLSASAGDGRALLRYEGLNPGTLLRLFCLNNEDRIVLGGP